MIIMLRLTMFKPRRTLKTKRYMEWREHLFILGGMVIKKIRVIKLQIAMIRIAESTSIMIILLILIRKIRICMRSNKTVTPKTKIRAVYRISKSTKLSGFLRLSLSIVAARKEEHSNSRGSRMKQNKTTWFRLCHVEAQASC